MMLGLLAMWSLTRRIENCYWLNCQEKKHGFLYGKGVSKLFFFFIFFNFWLHCVFVAARGLSLVVAIGGYSSLPCAGFSLWWLHLLQSTGSRCTGSVVVVHGLSCSTARRIFPDQGSNPCPLHWQADS